MYFATTTDSLKVVLEGREQVAALKAKVQLPRSCILNISYTEVFTDWRNWEVRMPGTYAPKLLMAGSYWTEHGWDFVYAKKPRGFLKPTLKNVLVIETNLNKFNRVIVGCKRSEAEEVIDWFKAKTKK